MPIRLYKPKSNKPLPLMVHFPGGGSICGNRDTEDHQARYFAAKIPCLVVSVEYPKSSKANMDETIAHGVMAVEWARLKAPSVNADPTNTLVCGGSAGCILSEQVAYHFTTTDQHNVLKGCLLLYTASVHWDYAGPHKHMHKSWGENGHAKVPLFGLGEAKQLWADLDVRPNDPKHFIFMAPDLSQFPPSYLLSVEKDCWRDWGKMLELRLEEAGVPRRYDFYPGLPHWFHVFPQLSASHEMMGRTVEARFLLAGGK